MDGPHSRKIGWGALILASLALLQIEPALSSPSQAATPTLAMPDSELEPLTWRELDGWATEDHKAAFANFVASCSAVVDRRKSDDTRPIVRPLRAVCQRALRAGRLKDAAAKSFLEANLRPLRISKLGDPAGFLTGYYEPIVEGSRVATSDYTVPVYRRPNDLIAGAPRRNGAEFPNKGPVFRKVGNDEVAYYDRAEIENGALQGRNLEICYLKDPIDAFFIHIQGSARVRLAEGGTMRINYDGHNGYPYTPVGRILIERNLVSKDEMSMERIRQYMRAHPDDARELRRQNRSYVFFRVTGLADHEEAVGAQGAALTPGRSIAVDKALHAYGTPFWIEAQLPIATEQPNTPFRRFMIAQDTGSAIVGPARADIYFGAGSEAGVVSGRIRHPAKFVMLVPRSIDPARAAKKMPLPRPKPRGLARSDTASHSSPASKTP